VPPEEESISKSKWHWNETRELAAQLLSDGRYSYDQIGKKVGRDPRNVKRWAARPEFKARVAEHVAKFQAEISKTGLALKSGRIHALKCEAARVLRVYRQRSEDYATATVRDPAKEGGVTTFRIPGGDTGLVIPVPKAGGEMLYAVDTATMGRYLAVLREIAIEQGEYKQKIEHSGAVQVDLSMLTDEEFAQLKRLSAAAQVKSA